jgi:hypothetical protein
MNEQMMEKSRSWKKVGIGAAVVAVIAAAVSMFSFHKAQVYSDMAQSVAPARAADSADSQVKTAPRGAAATEHGAWAVVQTRPCQPGMTNVTSLHKEAFAAGECGEVAEEARNFLANQGESDILACVYRGSCPTGFLWALIAANGGVNACTAGAPSALANVAGDLEGVTWANISASECAAGTSGNMGCADYESATKTITRDSSGWSGLDTVASGTGGCTETSCARVSTAQQTVTATGNWSGSAVMIVIRAATSNNVFAVACLSTGRTLQSGDQLNLTYRQAMQ